MEVHKVGSGVRGLKRVRNNSDVTVIVPTLKGLRDVLGDPFLLVVDGNSADGTVRAAKELGAEVMLQRGGGKVRGILKNHSISC